MDRKGPNYWTRVCIAVIAVFCPLLLSFLLFDYEVFNIVALVVLRPHTYNDVGIIYSKYRINHDTKNTPKHRKRLLHLTDFVQKHYKHDFFQTSHNTFNAFK